MKRLALIFGILLVSVSNLLAQSDKNGGMDGDMATINAEANINFGKWSVGIGGQYNLSTKKIEEMHVKVGMKAGDIVVAAELSVLSKKPIDEVIRVYKLHKNKGWGYIAKQLGIKPGSAEFHALKANVGKKAKGGTSSGSKKGGASNGKAKGKGKK